MEILIRDAEEGDAEAIAGLLTELGYPQDGKDVVLKLKELAEVKSFRVFVAEYEHNVAGVTAFDIQPLFHQAGKIGTIMAMVVAQKFHRLGIGRALVGHIERIAHLAGCVRIAVASGIHRKDAHQFYRSLGYEEITKRFVKSLSE